MSIVKMTWFDPGVTSGYTLALYDFEANKLTFSYGQVQWTELGLFKFINKIQPHTLGYESFEYRSGLDKVDLTPCYLIGVIHMIEEMREPRGIQIYSQKPAMKDQYFSAHRLKELGFYARGLEHGRDSVRHFLYWFFFGAGAKFWMSREQDIPGRIDEPSCDFVPMSLVEMQWQK